MEPVEIAVLCILLVIIAALIGYIVVMKMQIRNFNKRVRRLLEQDYDEMIKVDMYDKDIVRLAESMNSHVFRQRKLAGDYIRDREILANLVSGISHDFRTPLTASIGYLQMIDKSDELKSDKNREYLKIALEKNNYLKKLSDDFFDISKMGRRVQRDINIERIRLSSLLEERMLEQFEWINERGITPNINIDKDVYIDADIHDIDRILYNLFSNSQKYAVGTLGISLNSREMVVSNGIADECEIKADKVFEPFYRGVSRNKEGSGLGLYVVKCLADEYGFDVSADVVDKTFVFKMTIKPADS